MNLLKKFFIVLFSLFTVVTLYQYKTVPSGKLWDSYTVVYVPVSVDDSLIVDGFNQAGIEEFVCLSKQRVPVMFKLNSVEKAMFNINFNASDTEYLRRRENFFFDSARLYRLYYVPNEYKENVNSFIKEINKEGIEGGIDSTFAYPWLLPLITLIFSLIIILFSRRKLFVIASSFFSLIYVLCNPFYVCAISAFLLIILSFVITNLWSREGSVSKLLHSLEIYLFTGFAIILPFSNSVYSGLFFIMICVSTGLIIWFEHIKEKEILSKQTYTFLLIRNARQTPLFGGKKKKVLLTVSICVLSIFVSFILNSTQSFSGHFARVLLPGESSISSKELVNLDDYYSWNWKIKTSPYKSLNVSNNTNTVVYPDYVKKDGKIVRNDITWTFNQSFKDTVYSDIDNLDFYSIEQVLKSQGKDSSYGFTASSSYNVTIFSIILMILSVIMLIFLDISAIIRKGGNK